MMLVGDIGGTHGRFGVVADDGVRPDRVAIEEGDAHASFESAVAAYLEKLGDRPRRAAFAVAGPVDEEGHARITNRKSWLIDPAALTQKFGFETVLVLNDFAAQAASLPHLEPSELTAIGDAAPREATKAALGPGTGLGVAALVREADGGWLPLPSEGGHVELAATDAREAAVFEIVRAEKGRVEAEALLSGPGLVRLHAALARVEGRADDLETTAAEIVAAASGADGAARATVALFLTMLARFSGDVALTFGATGGVYLCGGVAPRLLGLLDAGAFRAVFEAKAPHERMLRAIATEVVTSPVAGLVGCAAYARRSPY